jgi:hypothetical protein
VRWPQACRAGAEAGTEDVGDQALMRGLVTAVPNIRLEAFPVLRRALAMPATKSLTGVPLPWPCLHPCAKMGQIGAVLLHVNLFADRPDEPTKLASDRGYCHIQFLAAPRQSSVASTQPELCFGSNVFYGRRDTVDLALL